MLCAPTREAVSEWLYRHHDVPTHSDENQALLRRAIAANRDEDIEVLRNSVQFGLASLQQYVEDPEEVYFVKSPKSFLGASGLKPQQVALFEDLVCAMMLHIKLQAESQLPEQIDQAVIGRPINFEGLGGDEANARRRGSLSGQPTAPASAMWSFSLNRWPPGSISKRPSVKKSGCWSSISAAGPPTAPCC